MKLFELAMIAFMVCVTVACLVFGPRVVALFGAALLALALRKDGEGWNRRG